VETVYTIGYDLRSIDEFLEIIKHYEIGRLIDVRRWVVSRRLPAYSSESLKNTLESVGVEYVWLPELGGYRRFGVDVDDHGVASCFESPGFRAYATYITMNPSVKPILMKLVDLVSEKTSVLMCREKNPYVCHRKILADYLVAKGFRVIHIIDLEKTIIHKLSKCASVIDGELRYV